MLGKILETTSRLTVYVYGPENKYRSIKADAWGFGQVSEKKCMVVREAMSQQLHVLGFIRQRSLIPREDLALMMRTHVVEEGENPVARNEWRFWLDEADEQTRNQVLRGPLIEPAPLIGGELHL
jgi:hypothetical protein